MLCRGPGSAPRPSPVAAEHVEAQDVDKGVVRGGVGGRKVQEHHLPGGRRGGAAKSAALRLPLLASRLVAPNVQAAVMQADEAGWPPLGRPCLDAPPLPALVCRGGMPRLTSSALEALQGGRGWGGEAGGASHSSGSWATHTRTGLPLAAPLPLHGAARLAGGMLPRESSVQKHPPTLARGWGRLKCLVPTGSCSAAAAQAAAVGPPPAASQKGPALRVGMGWGPLAAHETGVHAAHNTCICSIHPSNQQP